MIRKKLTKKVIEAAESKDKDYVIWDTDIKGFGCKVTPKSHKVFILKYRTNDGTQRKPVVGTYGSVTVETARELALDMIEEVRGGGDPSQERKDARKAKTVAELCDTYFDDYAKLYKKPLSRDDDEVMIRKYIKPNIGKKKVASLGYKDLDRLHRELKHVPIRANRVRALMSKMLNLAEKWGLRSSGSNPCRHITRYPENVVHRPLTDTEQGELAKQLADAERGVFFTDPKTKRLRNVPEDPRAVSAIRLLIFTGARRNEVLRLRWSEVDMDNSLLRLSDTKTGAKVIRLNSAAKEVVEAQKPKDGNPYVFPSPHGEGNPMYDVNGPWRRIRAAAGLEDVRLHDLRHNFAAAAAAGGLSLFQIGQLLGHRSPKTTARYSDLTDDPAQRAAEQVGAALEAAMSKRDQKK